MIEPGHLIQLVSPKGKRYLKVLQPETELHSQDGKISLADACQKEFGQTISTHLGKKYTLYQPTLYDLLKNIERKTQIMYPKDIGYTIMKLGIGPGSKVIEAGSGSGSLTMAFAWFVGPQGQVYSFEKRPEFHKLCSRNLQKVGLQNNVQLFHKDITEGFAIQGVEAIFIDVRTPWDFLPQISEAVQNGGPVGFLLPTMNQVSQLLKALQEESFHQVEVIEIFLRKYKPVWERLRPEDRMVAHTGYLIYCRCCK